MSFFCNYTGGKRTAGKQSVDLMGFAQWTCIALWADGDQVRLLLSVTWNRDEVQSKKLVAGSDFMPHILEY